MGIVEKPRNHKDLEVWKQSMELVDLIYRVTRAFPAEELYGLAYHTTLAEAAGFQIASISEHGHLFHLVLRRPA